MALTATRSLHPAKCPVAALRPPLSLPVGVRLPNKVCVWMERTDLHCEGALQMRTRRPTACVYDCNDPLDPSPARLEATKTSRMMRITLTPSTRSSSHCSTH